MDFTERLEALAKEAQTKFTAFVDQVKDKYEDSDLDEKVAAFKSEVGEKYQEFAGSVKGKIDETLKQGIADCIAARELIKVKVLENSEYDPREAADILCEALDCDCVQVIGRKFVLFKQKKKESAYAALLAK